MIPITRKPIEEPAWPPRGGAPLAGAYRTVYLGGERVGSGKLVLVNAAHPVRTFETRLAPMAGSLLQEASSQEPEVALDAECLAQLTALLDGCGGRERIAVVSGYRSKEKQREIYLDTLRERGPAYTESYVALPGASEHQTGLAVDVGLADGGLDYIAPSFSEGAEEAASFKRLAPAYGFIQRYEEGKTAVTGIACEPWHFRYVGRPHAAVMARENLCLEEYTAFMKTYAFGGKHLIVADAGLLAETYYVPAASGFTPVPVPAAGAADWDVSGNNEDGFVVTAVYGKGAKRHGR
ncbi:D-alanyl-D-alanine dipeptidase/carboxypeptidase [Paenibacillus sp. UNC496MF]|uniref:D-alanyl-D-alanine carboxypeptidase family protein n=1 Tax=Paenibacillus sp. UNC496MF TaxID=1502753 RepID=UPI0008ECCF9D|nr:D-alanyl-D-alanine carboxypeptidase family protein [Paenibacillus sp. UNC496MF]SFI49245.1 D-alanyl-D-alanine dipeptidase/carboxypeptidase [Paenibacillus sp. UNC496MF]